MTGRAVPGEAAVVGYGDSALAEALDLTSVHQPFAETGRIAISLLFAAMDGTVPTIRGEGPFGPRNCIVPNPIFDALSPARPRTVVGMPLMATHSRHALR